MKGTIKLFKEQIRMEGNPIQTMPQKVLEIPCVRWYNNFR